MMAMIADIIIRIQNRFTHIWKHHFMMPYWKRHFKKMGENVYIGDHCDFIYDHIEIGNDVSIGDYASFIATIATIHIGNHVMFGPNVTIRGGNHRTDIVGRYMKSIKDIEKLPENDEDVFIDDDVWIGCNVTILKGVHIGKGSIIGAGSVVTKDVAPYMIHVGCKSVMEKRRFTDEQIIEHEQLIKDL